MNPVLQVYCAIQSTEKVTVFIYEKVSEINKIRFSVNVLYSTANQYYFLSSKLHLTNAIGIDFSAYRFCIIVGCHRKELALTNSYDPLLH